MTATCVGVASILLRAARRDAEHEDLALLCRSERTESLSISYSSFSTTPRHGTLLGDLRRAHGSIESELCREQDLRPWRPSSMQIFHVAVHRVPSMNIPPFLFRNRRKNLAFLRVHRSSSRRSFFPAFPPLVPRPAGTSRRRTAEGLEISTPSLRVSD